jgi:DNA processing protein
MNRKDAIRVLRQEAFPPLLREITDPPPRLFVRGTLSPAGYKHLCVVGSRSFSPYGKDVCERLIAGLSGYPVAVVSGLALGIDGIAHRAALSAGLPTIAVPGSGLDGSVLYPRTHLGLSRQIVEEGGALVSESEPMEEATVWSFPKRNRLMAGMCDAILIVEARERSGTLITARLGMEYNRDVLVVPAPIFTPYGEGSNRLLREGAQAVTGSGDILEALKIEAQSTKNEEQRMRHLSDEEQKIFSALETPMPRDELIRTSGLPAVRAQIVISSMEIKGFVCERLGVVMRTS